MHDPLTGLLNRAGLIGAMRDTSRLQHAVAFTDLDGFKEVNDTYGHETGDWLICAIALGLKDIVACIGTGLVARFGGDEFVAVFSGENAERHAEQCAEQIIDFVAHPFNLDGRQASVGASVGIAAAESTTSDELLRRADVAMYRAKETGRNRACVYTFAFDAERLENAAICKELKAIIDNNSIEVVYQPFVDTFTGAVIGVEALARWPRGSARRIDPERFIAIAELNGLIDDLGDIILRKACADALRWPNISVAINISSVQLKNPQFVERCVASLEDVGIDPNRIELELTERILVDDLEMAKQKFSTLRTRGIRVALDDFGTGFSSIGYLRALAFDRIKIDKSLVDNFKNEQQLRSIIEGTLIMANGMSALVTAEGVESLEQVTELRQIGCHNLQGYVFFKPMAADDIEAIINRPATLRWSA